MTLDRKSLLSPGARWLLEEPNVGHLATVNPDGSPQVTCVWVDVRDDLVLVNTTEGTVKIRNVRRDPRVALSVADRANPYRRIYVRGRVVGSTTEGALEHKEALARKYSQGFEQRTGRVILEIRPERVNSKGV